MPLRLADETNCKYSSKGFETLSASLATSVVSSLGFIFAILMICVSFCTVLWISSDTPDTDLTVYLPFCEFF